MWPKGWRVVASLICVAIAPGGFAKGQYLYLDVSGDANSTISDVVDRARPNEVDIWIRTDQNRDGSAPKALRRDPAPLTINSYEVILHAEDGTVDWMEYANLQPSMKDAFGTEKSGTDLYVGYGGATLLPPGLYRLGRAKFRVVSGNPRITVAPLTSIHPRYRTSFGSRNPGLRRDNTLRLGVMEESAPGDAKGGAKGGDWSDTDGLLASSEVAGASEAGTSPSTATLPRFEVSVLAGSPSGYPALRVITTKIGKLKVRIFSPSGRLIRTVVSEEQAPARTRDIQLGSPRSAKGALPSGVYFYRVEALEGTLTGRFVVVK